MERLPPELMHICARFTAFRLVYRKTSGSKKAI